MIVKTLSVKQPWATYICAGLKDVENRTWTTDYRGRLLIHVPVSDKSQYQPDSRLLPPGWQDEYRKAISFEGDGFCEVSEGIRKYMRLCDMADEFYGMTDDDFADNDTYINKIKTVAREKGFFMPAGAIIGECVLADVVQNHAGEWAQDMGPKTYHWVIKNPVLYEKPVKNVMGKLRLWDFDLPDIV